MGKPSKQLQEFMAKHKIDHDEIWEVRSGGAWAIKHAVLERVAAEQKITFDIPQFAEKDSANKIVAMMVMGRMGERTEWSIGEASPANNKNAYCYAMAEKRAKDRVALKLLNAHGALYSESEADEFSQRPNPHVTRPDDLVPTVEYDEHGQPIDNIPLGDDRITQLPKSKARNEYATLQSEMLAAKTPDALERWGATNKNRVATLPSDWQDILRGQYTDHMGDIRARMAAERNVA